MAFSKKSVPPWTLEKIGQKRILSGVIAYRKEVGTTHIAVILRMEAFHHLENITYGLVLSCHHKRRDVLRHLSILDDVFSKERQKTNIRLYFA